MKVLALFVLLFASVAQAVEIPPTDIGAFRDAGGPHDSDFQEGTYADVPSTAWFPAHTANELEASRTVIEFDLNAVSDSSSALLRFWVDSVVGTPVIQAYGYYGDGTVSPADADQGSLVASTLVTGRWNRDLLQIDLDVGGFINDALNAGQKYVGFVIRVDGDVTDNKNEAITVWSGRVDHDVSNKPDPLLDIGEPIPPPPVECTVNVDCPDAEAITYIPPLPELGNYPLAPAGVCTDILDPATATSVTVGESVASETMDQALDRLRSLSPSGGILYVPHDHDEGQCPVISVNGAPAGFKFVIKGILGPNGERPYVYCRSDLRGGTIPNTQVAGTFVVWVGATKPQQFQMDNMHIDGYKETIATTSLFGAEDTRLVLRNNYAHHQRNDGFFGSSNSYYGTADVSYELCGNEISHAGQGNFAHGIYMHRGHGSTERTHTLHYYHNICHSTPYSSCLKSIADFNYIKGNIFAQSLTTDESYNDRYSSLLVDVALCAQNDIQYNHFYGFKEDATARGDRLIGLRNRRDKVRGCDDPYYWDLDAHPDAGETTYPPSPLAYPYGWTLNPEFHSATYWSTLNPAGTQKGTGTKLFFSDIKNNVFYQGPATPEGAFGHQLHAIDFYGTFPNQKATTGLGYWLQAPVFEDGTGWYERALARLESNTYKGFTESRHMWVLTSPGDCTNTTRGCPDESDGEDTAAPYPDEPYDQITTQDEWYWTQSGEVFEPTVIYTRPRDFPVLPNAVIPVQ